MRNNKLTQLIVGDDSQDEGSDRHLEEESKITTNSTALPPDSSINLEKEKEVHGTTGATGATNEVEVDEPDSSEQSSAYRTRKMNLPNKNKPKMSLMIDTEIINEMYNHGGERGEMRHEAAMEILETEICELAAHCVAAMKKVKKKSKSNFQKLLEEAVEN